MHSPTLAGGEIRRRFWTGFAHFMETEGSIPCGSATTDNSMFHDGGLNCGGLFSLLRTRLGEIGVQFALDEVTAASVYAFLRQRRPSLEAAFGEQLDWHHPPGTRTYILQARTALDTSDERAWPGAFVWLRDHLAALQGALWPVLGREPSAGEERIQWDEQGFSEQLLSLNPAALPVARDVLALARRSRLQEQWGRGARTATVTLGLLRGAVRYQLVSLSGAASFSIRLGDLRRWEPFHRPAARLELLEQLNHLPHMDLDAAVIDKRPSLPLLMLGEDGALEELAQVIALFRTRCTDLPW